MRVHLAVPVSSFCWFGTALHLTCSSAALAYPTLIIAIAFFDTKRATITHVYITLSLTAHICISYSRRGMPLPCSSGTMYNLRITLHHLLCDNDTLALNCSSRCAVPTRVYLSNQRLVFSARAELRKMLRSKHRALSSLLLVLHASQYINHSFSYRMVMWEPIINLYRRMKHIYSTPTLILESIL